PRGATARTGKNGGALLSPQRLVGCTQSDLHHIRFDDCALSEPGLDQFRPVWLADTLWCPGNVLYWRYLWVLRLLSLWEAAQRTAQYGSGRGWRRRRAPASPGAQSADVPFCGNPGERA